MSDNFFKLNKGLTLNPQSQYGSGDPAGVNGDIYYNEVLEKFRKFQNGFWTDLDTNSGSSGSILWVAQEVVLSASSTSESVGFTSPQPDTSYVVFAMMENLVDAHPQYQQVEVVNKTVNGFNVKWNAPLSSGNYILSFVVPPKTFTVSENGINAGATSLTPTFAMPQAASSYGVIAQIQDQVDAFPQFQTTVVTNKTTANDTLSWNAPTSSNSYVMAQMFNASSQVSIGSGQTSAVVPLPVDYGTTSYGIIVTAQNLIDAHPQFQPLIITSKTTNSVTVSWNVPTDTSSYVLTAYAISVTP